MQINLLEVYTECQLQYDPQQATGRQLSFEVVGSVWPDNKAEVLETHYASRASSHAAAVTLQQQAQMTTNCKLVANRLRISKP